jgi:hypothetical protein
VHAGWVLTRLGAGWAGADGAEAIEREACTAAFV